jgi:hypothetical protein
MRSQIYPPRGTCSQEVLPSIKLVLAGNPALEVTDHRPLTSGRQAASPISPFSTCSALISCHTTNTRAAEPAATMAGTSLFLSLPRELRDEIYKFALPPTIFCLTFHVVHGSRGFTSVALPLPDQRDFIYSFHLREGETGFKDVLPLLLSC